MPGRNIPLVTGEVYHVFNRGISNQPTYFGANDYKRVTELIRYYRHNSLPLRYSYYKSLSLSKRNKIHNKVTSKNDLLVDVISYCLMPNHFHLLLKQLKDGGISKFTGNITNSYTRYFNTKNNRVGPLYQGKFKAVRIGSDEQLIHVSRYIHLNPYTSFVVKTARDLKTYPYSSFIEYLNPEMEGFCEKELILNNFKNHKSYIKFVFDNADYQREFKTIKHLVLENE